MAVKPEICKLISNWELPEHGTLQERIDGMIRPAVLSGELIGSPTARVAGLQYHLGGQEDTRQLAKLARVGPEDIVLDVACYLGGPALQLAEDYGCRVTGVDVSEEFISAAGRIAELAGYADRVEFEVARATELPFDDGCFTVVWCQGLLEHEEEWIGEFDRVLAPAGRLAMTFSIRLGNPDEKSPRWSLQEAVDSIESFGYSISHVEDITQRDIEIGWEALDRKLDDEHDLFAAALGEGWIGSAHEKFAEEIRRMREGRWGNGRIVAVKGS